MYLTWTGDGMQVCMMGFVLDEDDVEGVHALALVCNFLVSM